MAGGEYPKHDRGTWAAFPSFLLVAALAGCVMETRARAPRILFIGNSITQHPKLDAVGWPLEAGMAATSLENDYVHQTVSILKQRGLELEPVLGSRDCDICDGVIGEHIENADAVWDIRPRYVVVQLGENSAPEEIRSGRLTDQYRELLEILRRHGAERIFCISGWDEGTLASDRNEAILRAIRRFPGTQVVDISSLAGDRANYGDSAIYPNPGVAWHPGDLGMRRIAEKLADAILEDDR